MTLLMHGYNYDDTMHCKYHWTGSCVIIIGDVMSEGRINIIIVPVPCKQ